MPKSTCSTPGCPGKARASFPRPCPACTYWMQAHPGSSPTNRPALQPARTCKEGDGKKVFGYGWCQTHYLRWRAHGDPHARQRRANGELAGLLRAAAHSATDECIVISGHKGRAHVRFNGVGMPASRAAWILAHGDPGELHVLHTCNGGSGENGCVNPAHLYLGSNAQNRQDMVRADRSHHGSEHHGAKLNEAKVREIRNRWAAGARNKSKLAREYQVSESTIRRVVNRTLWARVGN